MSVKIIERIKHYQKDIEKCPDNSERMMRCIQKLYLLPVKVEHLQETGVGRSVNSLRKYKGEVGDAAKALVAKWKAMVAAEESGDESQVPSNKSLEKKVSQQPPPPAPPPIKTEQKTDRYKESNERTSNKDYSSSNSKHHSDNKVHQKDTKTHHVSNEKSSENKHRSSSSSASSKRSHSSSNSSNHISEKNDSSSKNHKSHNDKKHKSDLDDKPPPHKKQKHSHSKGCSSSKKVKAVSESEEESSENEDSYSNEASERGSDSEEESEVESDGSKSEPESDSSSDNRHHSKHKSSHHKHKHSSHSKDREKDSRKKHEEVKHRTSTDKSKDKDKNKENHSHKSSNKHSNKKSSSTPDYNELIKENEMKVKKEKEDFASPPVPKYTPTPVVKIETNEDGSIDSGSGASFADALLGMDSYGNQKKKKKSPSGSSYDKNSKSSKTKSSSNVEGVNSNKLLKASSSSPSKSRSINELVEETPELLTKQVKLEELDIDLSSTLPEINPNYRPLPHVPERTRQVKMMSDEDTMFSLMTTKNKRTKVFSGNKVYQNSVPTLFNLCIQLLYDNIDSVEYTGGVPYNLLKPLLEKLNADQLYVLEHYNPYLVEETDNLWKFHCNKDFRSERRQDMESWRELYLRCLDERERKLKALTANISQSMAKSTPVRQAKLAYVDTAVKPPRNVARKQAKYGTGGGSGTTIPTKNATKQEIVSKAVVGANTPGVSAKDVVPTPPPVARAAAHHPTPAIVKKKKAPLMQKALQVMKGTRYKR